MHTNTVPLRILLFFAALFAFSGASSVFADTETASTLRLSRNTVTMKVGDTTTIAVSNANGRVSVESGDKSVVAASYANNVVTLKALKAGATRVKVKDRTNSVNVAVTVGASTTSTTPGLAVSPPAVVLTVGGTAAIAVSNASGTVSVSSSETSVATISYAAGMATVKGLKAGTTTVTVRDSKTSKQVGVTVTAATSQMSLSPSFVAISAGGTGNVTVSNAAGGVQQVVSGDASVATATFSGNMVTIKGIKAGSTQIMVRDTKTAVPIQVSVLGTPVTTLGGYALLAWNDLGMHCVDGKDYSVFSILPPYNNLHAQLVNKATGKQVTSGVTLTYEAIEDDTVPPGDPAYRSINTTSYQKTNFWAYVKSLFGAQPDLDKGLNLTPNGPSNQTPSLEPKPMIFDAESGQYVAEGLPITPVDDKGLKNFYPMVKVVAKNTAGAVLATAKTVLPVSDEMTCKVCHASDTVAAAKPAAGWLRDTVAEKDWKRNILRLHDEKQSGKSAYELAKSNVGYGSGLLVSADSGKPVLCAACHSSNALNAGGQPNVSSLTSALHGSHAKVQDPTSTTNPPQTLGDSTNRDSCYMCHPGSKTQCLRGAMSAPGQSCQNCHGTMAQVGNNARTGWLEQPNCQACHHDGKRETVGVDASGKPKVWADKRFASNPDTPKPGFSLYRFSKGHGGLQCESCHGATHAEYPSTHAQDNALSIGLQGHAGTVAECTACHANVPNTVDGGPHGMHTTGDVWVRSHEDANKTGCKSCHGTDYRGTALSSIKVAKTINKKVFPAGHKFGCYDCHNGPNP